MAQEKVNGVQLEIQSVATEIANDATAISSIATGLSTAAVFATNDLSDVDTTTTAPTTSGEVLAYDGASLFVNRVLVSVDISDAGTTLATFAQGALADTALQDITLESIGSLSDVILTSAAITEVLQHNGTNWVNVKLPAAGVVNTPAGGIAATTVQAAIDELDTEKADKVTAPTLLNFVELDGTGNLIDGASNASDFATAAQGATADTATQPLDNISTLTNDSLFTTDAAVAVNHYTKTESDATTPAAGAKVDKVVGVSGNVVEFGVSNVIADSGVARTSLAPIDSPSFTTAIGLPSYLKASLPAQGAGDVIYVSDATGSSLTGSMCFSNGTVWIDVTTGIAVV